jgi:N-acetylglucosaminyldiphosphoundecaprenol N-acetyl-beta-D-mannosaminyltransferase
MRWHTDEADSVRRILGVNFFTGDVRGAIARMSRGGLLVVPAAPALKDIASNESYREALTNADMAITDSAFMVVLWNWLQRDSLRRVSGLTYLRELLFAPEVRAPGSTVWIMAGGASTEKNLAWLDFQGIAVPENCVYEAPIYGSNIQDPDLIERLQRLRPRHIVITLGGGTQERLGLYIKRNLDYSPAIHCIGAAIAFLSGDQVRIPTWADHLYLGWLFRCVSSPGRYIPRYWSAFVLLPLLWRYRDRLPPIQAAPSRRAHAEA